MMTLELEKYWLADPRTISGCGGRTYGLEAEEGEGGERVGGVHDDGVLLGLGLLGTALLLAHHLIVVVTPGG